MIHLRLRNVPDTRRGKIGSRALYNLGVLSDELMRAAFSTVRVCPLMRASRTLSLDVDQAFAKDVSEVWVLCGYAP